MGSTSSSGAANTNIRATVPGTVLQIPVKVGNQVIESNNFNAGTTIASIADMTKMIFEGKVDEAEVGKIKSDTELEIALGAVEDKKFPAKMTFIAPKGTEESGTVQFTIKADVTLDKDYFYVPVTVPMQRLYLNKKTVYWQFVRLCCNSIKKQINPM